MVGAFILTKKFVDASAGTAANGDSIQLITINRELPDDGRRISSTDATLGASCTLQLRRRIPAAARTDLIRSATTAGAASVVPTAATIGCVDLAAGDIIEALVGGANITAAAPRSRSISSSTVTGRF
jgi:hypothetical protein